ncbi:hypothetical protein B7494_g6532 [Chlorociboria aeruginascens]|nr:hypothetical protein B7494_g6532 [Chlorociboria aeruginascens]
MATLSSPLTLSNPSSTKIPRLIYGTAWKKETTVDLVYQAIKAGFRGIDTAAQPRHYREDLIQTKFTSTSGQDTDNMPYSPDQSLEEQIHTSVASSLKNFTFSKEEPYIDCLVLHSPFRTNEENTLAWKVLSAYHPTQIHALGLSNIPLPVLKTIHSSLSPKPCVVQNRFYAGTAFEVPLRKFCREEGIVFQSFWTYTGNPGLMKNGAVKGLALELGKMGVKEGEREVVALYGLVLGLDGVSILDGTKREERMKGDLEGVEMLGQWREREGKGRWNELIGKFREVIGEGY